jgi:hypothetical protein
MTTSISRDRDLSYILGVPINGIDFVSKGQLQAACINLSQQANRAELAASEWMQKLYDEKPDHPAFKGFNAEVISKLETARITRQAAKQQKEIADG